MALDSKPMLYVGDSVILGDENYSFDNPVMTVVGVRNACEEALCGWFDERKRYQEHWFHTEALEKLNVEEEDEEEETEEEPQEGDA